MTHNEQSFHNPWSSSDTQLNTATSSALPPPTPRRSLSEDQMYQNNGHNQQRASRVTQMRSGAAGSSRRQSSSSLSNAMGTHRSPGRQSSTSSPSSEESLHDMQMAQFAHENGIDLVALQYGERTQDISMLSPAHPQTLMLAGLSMGNQTVQSPYSETPPTLTSDLPPTGSPGFAMQSHHYGTSAYPPPSQSISHRPSSYNLPDRTSRGHAVMPSSAPAISERTYIQGNQGTKTPSPPNSMPRYPVGPSPFMYMPLEGAGRGDLAMQVSQLSKENSELQNQISRLQEQLFIAQAQAAGSSIPAIPSVPNIPPLGASMEASWERRTAARTRRFCAPNRAGNALCAWHDTRRERRAHPPRNAPPNTLNCGCTFEEALFEESLARHGVGSYHPGESVRMDPSLRNPLLKLLKTRYGYRDGDFEIDPRTGTWLDGDGHEVWEQSLLQSGASHKTGTRK